jgi:hypothetical protein
VLGYKAQKLQDASQTDIDKLVCRQKHFCTDPQSHRHAEQLVLKNICTEPQSSRATDLESNWYLTALAQSHRPTDPRIQGAIGKGSKGKLAEQQTLRAPDTWVFSRVLGLDGCSESQTPRQAD